MTKRKGKVRVSTDDIIGKCLGKLEVISYAGSHHDTTKGGERLRHYYRVQCECGTIKIIQRGPLVDNLVHSCGCVRRKG